MGTGIGWTMAALSLKTGTSIGSGLVSCEAPSRAMVSEEESNATLTVAGGPALTHYEQFQSGLTRKHSAWSPDKQQAATTC